MRNSVAAPWVSHNRRSGVPLRGDLADRSRGAADAAAAACTGRRRQPHRVYKVVPRTIRIKACTVVTRRPKYKGNPGSGEAYNVVEDDLRIRCSLCTK